MPAAWTIHTAAPEPGASPAGASTSSGPNRCSRSQSSIAWAMSPRARAPRRPRCAGCMGACRWTHPARTDRQIVHRSPNFCLRNPPEPGTRVAPFLPVGRPHGSPTLRAVNGYADPEPMTSFQPTVPSSYDRPVAVPPKRTGASPPHTAGIRFCAGGWGLPKGARSSGESDAPRLPLRRRFQSGSEGGYTGSQALSS